MITCHILTAWYEKDKYMGYIIDDNGNMIASQIHRDTREEALQDAERMKEELEHGVDRR